MGIHPQPHLTDASPDPLAADDAAGRRSFLRKVAIGGAAAAVGGQLLSAPAFGQEDDESTTTAAEGGAAEEDAVALTADEERVTFLAGISLAAAGAYKAATGTEPSGEGADEEASAEPTTTLPPIQVPPMSEPVVEVLRRLGAQHTGQAVAFNALLTTAVEAPNTTLLTQVRSQLGAAADQSAVLGILRDMTEQIAATQMTAIGDLEEVNDTKVVAAAMPVLGEHVVVIGQLTTPPVELVSLVPTEQTTDGALAPADYPAEAGTGDPAEDTPTTTDANAGGEGAEPGATTAPSSEDGTESSGGAADSESEG